MKRLILGGARSGKSSLAERYAAQSDSPVTYIATAQAFDNEMVDRIQRHQQSRPSDWGLVEEPLALASVIAHHAEKGHCILVDCLTLWLSNLLMLEDEARFTTEREALLTTIQTVNSPLLLVSNEVGHGIVPMNALSRRFVDESGWLHQDLATHCDRVEFVIAGLSQQLK